MAPEQWAFLIYVLAHSQYTYVIVVSLTGLVPVLHVCIMMSTLPLCRFQLFVLEGIDLWGVYEILQTIMLMCYHDLMWLHSELQD